MCKLQAMKPLVSVLTVRSSQKEGSCEMSCPKTDASNWLGKLGTLEVFPKITDREWVLATLRLMLLHQIHLELSGLLYGKQRPQYITARET